MKPLTTETQDAEALQLLGRASVQVVHDLKNQLNGLKLYATFLRKRLERAERPAEELDTLAKIVEGLEQGAADTGLLVRFGRPVELKRAGDIDIVAVVRRAVADLPVEHGEEGITGEFDASALAEAFGFITAASSASVVRVRRVDGDRHAVVVEWVGASPQVEGGAFNSFAGTKGMRLALAAKLVRAHGGEATHEGSVMRVTLPLAAG